MLLVLVVVALVRGDMVSAVPMLLASYLALMAVRDVVAVPALLRLSR